jgi:hypothetical protein
MGQHVPAETVVVVGGVVMALHCAGDAYFRACELAIQRRPWISGMQKENGGSIEQSRAQWVLPRPHHIRRLSCRAHHRAHHSPGPPRQKMPALGKKSARMCELDSFGEASAVQLSSAPWFRHLSGRW